MAFAVPCALTLIYPQVYFDLLLTCLSIFSFTWIQNKLSLTVFYLERSQTKMTLDMDSVARSYRNMTLSFRGAERQAPNTLQVALRFAKIMDDYASNGTHHLSMTVDPNHPFLEISRNINFEGKIERTQKN